MKLNPMSTRQQASAVLTTTFPSYPIGTVDRDDDVGVCVRWDLLAFPVWRRHVPADVHRIQGVRPAGRGNRGSGRGVDGSPSVGCVCRRPGRDNGPPARESG